MIRELFSMEAEHGVLGAIMRNNELSETIGAFLDMADFHDSDNGALYALLLATRSKGVAADPITLSELRQELPSGDLTLVYAAEIMRNVASAANGVNYARIVKERARARKMHSIGQAIKELAETRGSLAEQIAQAQAMMLDLGASSDRKEVFTLREALASVYDGMEARRNGVKDMGLEFGLGDLDRIVKCLRPGNLVIVAGRPGTGKTVLGCNLADRVATQHKGSALIYSLEMTREELAKRSVAAQSEVTQDRIDSGECLDDMDERINVENAREALEKADVRICDIHSLTFGRLCSIARFEHRAKPLDLIVVDYIGLVQGDPNWRYQNRSQELGAVSRGLKALAKELGIPIIALAQLNRAMESRGDGKPKMSDLRDSGEIEQDADVIILAHRDQNSAHGRDGVTEIEVAKVRHAKPGGCLLQFQGHYARFVPSAVTFEQYRGGTGDERTPPRKTTADVLRGNRFNEF